MNDPTSHVLFVFYYLLLFICRKKMVLLSMIVSPKALTGCMACLIGYQEMMMLQNRKLLCKLTN